MMLGRNQRTRRSPEELLGQLGGNRQRHRGPEALRTEFDLRGNLAAMLLAATNAKRSPETGDLSLQLEMVAGACNRRY